MAAPTVTAPKRHAIDVESVPVETTAVIEVNGETKALAAPETPKQQRRGGNLAAALAEARDRCRAAEQDKRNTFHRYDYASAESIITAARSGLEESGISLVPVSTSIDGHAKLGEARYELHRRFILMHESGESLPVEITWPVVEEKGRPLDKAAAIADTTSLAYYLRDLLLIPRVKPDDDVDARDDSQVEEPEPAPRQEQMRPAPAAKQEASDYQLQRIDELIRLGNFAQERIDKLLAYFGVKTFAFCTPEQAAQAIKTLEAASKPAAG